jgi:hypothetical protein
MDEEIAVLTMANGSQQKLHLKRGEDVLDLFNRCLKNPDCAEAQAISHAVSISERDGHMIEAVAALLNSPTEEKGELIQ